MTIQNMLYTARGQPHHLCLAETQKVGTVREALLVI